MCLKPANATGLIRDLISFDLGGHDDDELINGYFQQDGTTSHATGTTSFLSNFYTNRLICRNAPNNWPPRSCHLTLCEFFFFVSIYNTFINNLTGLQDRVLMKINQINENPMVLEHVVRNGVRRQATLSLQEGAHFQNLS
jgi:hypothetical protein